MDMQMMKTWILVLAAALLAGCAGTKFVRPAETQLQLGKTTEQQVTAMLGKPYGESTGLANGVPTRTLSYAYASMGSQSKSQGVTPVHGLTLVFHEGKLVSKQYMSNLKEDATDFDHTRVPQIVALKTTGQQVQALLGPASGESIYPVVKDPKGRAVAYQYQEMRGFTPSTKSLTVTLDANGVVTDVQYQNQGTWK
jgi:hypothetical protein